MLKSFEYIDPLLAQKIKTLQMELKKVEQSKEEILGNKKLAPTTRERLLQYQSECSTNIQKLLSQEKDKLAEYLDQQTNVVTKTNRTSASKVGKSHNNTLNQSTRIDFSTVDDSKSLDLTTKTEINRKVSSFYLPPTERVKKNGKHATKTKPRMKRLKKRLAGQQKLISMLVTWIKIYYERQQTFTECSTSITSAESQALTQQNRRLELKCQQLEEDISRMRRQFKSQTSEILQTQRQYQQLKEENSSLKLERRQLLNIARSQKKPPTRF